VSPTLFVDGKKVGEGQIGATRSTALRDHGPL